MASHGRAESEAVGEASSVPGEAMVSMIICMIILLIFFIFFCLLPVYREEAQ